MSTHFTPKVVTYVIGSISSCEQNMIQFENIPNKDKWEYCDVIPLFPLLGSNHILTLLHTSRKFVFINTTEERINQFEIGYLTNTTLCVNNVSKDQY